MNPTPGEIGIWVSVLALVVSLVSNIVLAVSAVRTQKREVTMMPGGATKEELVQMRIIIAENKTDADEGRRTIYQKIEALRIELKEDIQTGNSGVHKRVDEVLTAVSELRGEMKRL